MPLTALLTTHRPRVEAVVQAWLDAGASGVALWSQGRPLAAWPATYVSDTPDLTVPLRVGRKALGELRLSGDLAAIATQVAPTAALLATLADITVTLDSTVGALAETEDQLLALYEVTTTTSNRLDSAALLHGQIQQTARLVKAVGAFALFPPDQIIRTDAPAAADALLRHVTACVHADRHEALLTAADVPLPWPAAATTLFVVALYTRDKQKMIGCMGIWFDRPAATLSPDLKLARSIAEHAGAQLEIALLHQELVAQARLQAEMDVARQVQVSLLPRHAPKLAGLDIHGESRPALDVGGDFFDFYLPTTPQTPALGFAVGDVSGKGMPAALLMAMTRTSLRTIWGRPDARPTPELALSRCNSELYDDFTEVGMMVTVFVGAYDGARGTLTYANAGHSPVIFCPAQGRARLLVADGPILGVLPVSLSQDQTLPFGPGDLLVILTDGFNEARDPQGEFFGIERLEQRVEQLAALPAREIARHLFDAVQHFARGHPQDDDQTILVIKRVA